MRGAIKGGKSKVLSLSLSKVKVIVGGAPLSQAFADDIGADGYGYDASNAVDIVKNLAGAE
jgi:methanogenic corrinoid protein MtbC1